MNGFGKVITLLFLVAILIACNSVQSTPTLSQADKTETTLATVSTVFAETPRAIPTAILTNTPLPTVPPPIPTRTSPPSRTSTRLAFTATSIPLSERIVYYYDINYHPKTPVPEGAIAITIDRGTWIGTAGFLASTYADEAYTYDTAVDLRKALEIALRDKRNVWVSFSLETVLLEVTFGNGHATVRLQGDWYLGPPSTSRDVNGPLVKAATLILLTVFANPAVQTAAIWLNEDTIANLGNSDRSDAKPADYVFTRAEIETYLKEHTYVAPSPTITPTPVPTSTEEATLSSTPVPITLTPDLLTCQLKINQKVSLLDRANLWSQPDVVTGSLIGTLPAGTSVYVISAPAWGRLQDTGISGWWWEISNEANGASVGWIWEGRIEECK